MQAEPGPQKYADATGQQRVLVFAGAFSTSDADRWLLDDLVDEFVAQGALVDVLVFDTQRVRPRGVERRNGDRIRMISVGPEVLPRSGAGKILSRLAAAARMQLSAYGILRKQTYDLGVFTSIAVMSAGLARRLRSANVIADLVFIEWDFFPVHQIEIGRLPGNIFMRSLRHLEYFCIANSDTIAVMSPANEIFLRKYFPKYRGRTLILPPWAKREESGDLPKSPRFTAMFGGQLVKGRGVETILRAAALLQAQNAAVDILIAGDGVLRSSYESLAASLNLRNVDFLGALPRPQYRDVLKTVHVGIAVTVAGVSVPAFPSKIVEYCSYSVPVLACLDAASDGGDLLLEYGAGLVVEAGDDHALAASLLQLEAMHRAGTLEEMARSAGRLFSEKFSSEHAALSLLRGRQAAAT